MTSVGADDSGDRYSKLDRGKLRALARERKIKDQNIIFKNRPVNGNSSKEAILFALRESDAQSHGAGESKSTEQASEETLGENANLNSTALTPNTASITEACFGLINKIRHVRKDAGESKSAEQESVLYFVDQVETGLRKKNINTRAQEKKIAELQHKIDKLECEIQDLKKMQKKFESQQMPQRIPKEGQFMTRKKFAELLKKQGLLVKHANTKEGQHVFHIIASANGGPDHTDNYLYALGGSFNMSLGANYDDLCCWLAGKEKARRAVAIALKVAKDPQLANQYIERRSKSKPVVVFTEGRHKKYCSSSPNAGDIADKLYKEGQQYTRPLRAARKARTA